MAAVKRVEWLEYLAISAKHRRGEEDTMPDDANIVANMLYSQAMN